MNLRSMLLAGAAATMVISSGGVALAQAAPQPAGPVVADNGGVGTLVVTARKRAENVQRVPETVTANSGQQLIQKNI